MHVVRLPGRNGVFPNGVIVHCFTCRPVDTMRWCLLKVGRRWDKVVANWWSIMVHPCLFKKFLKEALMIAAALVSSCGCSTSSPPAPLSSLAWIRAGPIPQHSTPAHHYNCQHHYNSQLFAHGVGSGECRTFPKVGRRREFGDASHMLNCRDRSSWIHSLYFLKSEYSLEPRKLSPEKVRT